MPESHVLLEVDDPAGRRVVLSQEAWLHIVQEHEEVAPHQAAVMAVVVEPDYREEDVRPARERFWRRGLGPSRWLFVVIDFGEQPGRVVTAFGRRAGPSGWWKT
jgi:hypothetical protein